jgi:flagellar biosynthesis protein FlhG
MSDFYAPSGPAPLDQAHGLRRLFAGRRRQVWPLVANPFVAFSGVVLDRLAAVLAGLGHEVLVVDAAATSPQPPELAALDLSAAIERLSVRVSYLAARGLPLAHIDTRGSAGAFIAALEQAAPQAQVVLLHADALDMSRMLKGRAVRPLLLGADHPDSIKHAYASCKLLAQRCGLRTFDLLLAAAAHSPRVDAIAASLARCAEDFLQAVLLHAALVDPAQDSNDAPGAGLSALVAAQLALGSAPEVAAAALAADPAVPAALRRPRAGPASAAERTHLTPRHP